MVVKLKKIALKLLTEEAKHVAGDDVDKQPVSGKGKPR